MPSELCSFHVKTPLETAVHLLVALFVPASYVPQIIGIATSDRDGNAGISGWYIILLTTSATAHFATRIKDLYSSDAWSCVRHGELSAFDAFSALVVYLQPFIHWASAIILLAVYVTFRSRIISDSGDERPTFATSTPSPPSNAAILAIVLTHAAILLPVAVYLLGLITEQHDEEAGAVTLILNTAYGIILRLTGALTSLTAAIPQIHLMVTRSRNSNNFDQDSSLSLLGLGLQVAAFLPLAVSQG